MDRFDLSNIAETYNLMYQKLNESNPNFFKKRGKEVSQEQFQKIFKMFLLFAQKELKIKQLPEINFTRDTKFSQKHASFGVITGKNKITVEILDRHPMDILRTVAHELVHYSQHTHNIRGSGVTGSKTENEANVKAGKLLRDFGLKYNSLFKLPHVE